jgi:hypothetical protein
MTTLTPRTLTAEEQTLLQDQLESWFPTRHSLFINAPIIYSICNPTKSTIFIASIVILCFVGFVIYTKMKLDVKIIVIILICISVLCILNYIGKTIMNSYIIKALPYMPSNADTLQYYKYYINKI